MGPFQLRSQVRPPRPEEMATVYDIEDQAFRTGLNRAAPRGVATAPRETHGQYRVLVEGGEVRAQLRLVAGDTWVRGHHFPLAGIASVASPPQFRRRGATRQLLVEVLGELQQRRIPLVVLYPVSYEFYRRLGWGVGALVRNYRLNLGDLASFLPGRGHIQALPAHEPDLLTAYLPVLDMLYHRYAARYSCMLLRDAVHWQRQVLSRDGHPQRAYVWQTDDGEPQGYIVYDWDQNRKTGAPTLRVREWVAITLAARQGLLAFLANHDSQAQRASWNAPSDDTLLLEIGNPRQEARLEPSFMVRLVNVAQALNGLWQRQLDDPPPPLSERLVGVGSGTPSGSGAGGTGAGGTTKPGPGDRRELLFTLAVADPLCPWNQVPLEIWVTPDGWQALPVQQGLSGPPDLECDIQTISQLFTGVLRVEEALALERIKQNQPGAAERLAAGLTATVPFMSDGF